eukprot:992025-Pyramimonas_sp.AAC.1
MHVGSQFVRMLGGTLSNLSQRGFPGVDRIPKKSKYKPVALGAAQPVVTLKIDRSDNNHLLHLADGVWGCRVCGRASVKRSIVVQDPCPGKPRVLVRCHDTHRMWSVSAELFFCMACGCHARRQ